jgi:superfamily II DNA or RNA helicase
MIDAADWHFKILRRSSTPAEYRVYRAGLEWDLIDPIVIESSDDFKSTPRWRDRLTPFHHQVQNLITFCRRLPVTLVADDVGLGKTISAGLIISELISRSRLSKILIVCPKLLGPQWQLELLEKFDLPAKVAIGRDLITADPGEIGAVITTYNSARLYLDKIPKDRFQMLVLDEAHKLRNLYGVHKPPEVAKRFRNALEERRFRFVLMLTATPIQNRLWDLYSLVDLLTVARGHQNPFGTEEMFARRFIGDEPNQARQLKLSAHEEFRSIVYGYMSRIRRGDAKLYFPDRRVERHQVEPTAAELELIRTIAKPIQALNRLVQISILQALASSPEALMAQLANMAQKGSVPAELAQAVQAIVTQMPQSAKLSGLGRLIEHLKAVDSERWRLVVFTGRRETQTTIQAFLERHGLKVGIINGDSGPRNQETIARFRNTPPDYRVIVSTEAGSEGVNLQVANVLVNYDLPWNPMLVEQRIGRIQRLASNHAHVAIYNITLRGTFEDYIVARLMEKLQMASQAIGDLESLLQGSDIGDGDADPGESFEERIRKLVLAALCGKDVQKATELEVKSIEDGRLEWEREAENIESMLGSMDGVGYVGPRAPALPTAIRSTPARDFTLAALQTLGAQVTPYPPDLFIVEENSGREYIRFEEHASANIRSTYYAAGNAAFQRLVSRTIATGIHCVDDVDHNPAKESEEIARKWVESFGGTPTAFELTDAKRCLNGKALVRVRATVAHDSYERLVEVDCSPTDHQWVDGQSALEPLPSPVENPASLGLDIKKLSLAVSLDEGISEFSRFYMERREQETHAAGDDERKRKQLHDEFTPRQELTLVGLEGRLHRETKVRAQYVLDGEHSYESLLNVIPHSNELRSAPKMDLCAQSGRSVPRSCLGQCEISGAQVLRHLLVQSELSSRMARSEFAVTCSLSGKRVLTDEVKASAVTGRLVTRALLKRSEVSGKHAEPEYFSHCEFTNAEALESELAVSELSGKRYRPEDQERSALSGKTGHKQEFTLCHETGMPIGIVEAERCELTGALVRPEVLQTCEVSGKRALPSEFLRCAVTGKRVQKRLLVVSNLSQLPILESMAIRSAAGNFCLPAEAKACVWSGRKCHPDDLRVCSLTGLAIHFAFATQDRPPRLRPLVDILGGESRAADEAPRWNEISTMLSAALPGVRSTVEAAVLSPDRGCLAICSEAKTLLGLRVQHIGAVFWLGEATFIGRIVRGKRSPRGWAELA